MKCAIRIAKTQGELFGLIRLREAVFVAEQGVPLEIELDDADDRAIHFVAVSGSKIVGTARLVVKGKTGKIGRMAVREDRRGEGIGSALIDFIRKTARRRGIRRLYLHAQAPAVPFYGRLGFAAQGKPFLEAGLPHRRMVLKQGSAKGKER